MVTYPEIRDLQMLLALSQRRHFTQAAADCGISQPAFSVRIRQLEEELGVPIVRRGNKFLGFTSDGERVIEWASQILANAEGLRQDMEMSRGALRGNLVIGVVPTALSYAADVSASLREACPGLAIQITSLTSAQIAHGLIDQSIDAGITYRDHMDNAALSFESVYRERYVLLVPAGLAPRKSGACHWAEAADLPLCLLSKDMHFRKIVDDALAQAGVRAEPVLESNSFTALLAQVTNGAAATIAPAILVGSPLLQQHTVSLNLIEPVIHHEIGLAVLHQQPRLPAIDALNQAIAVHDRENELRNR